VEAAAALAAGFRAGGAEAAQVPVADGGEGTAEVLHAVLGGEWRSACTSDPLGRPRTARWLVLPDGTAVVEAAAAIGLPLVAPDELDPLQASSFGFGELLAAALDNGADRLLVGLGGVASVDGGAGMRAAIGGRLSRVEVVVACDVENPLLGPRGAARVFGPQKGAGPTEIEELERRLSADRSLAPYTDVPGAGAAGGLGAALAALGARLVPGAPLVLERVGFAARARTADLVVTGEGTVDATTVGGKAPGTVLEVCRRLDRRCVIFGGRIVEPPQSAEVRALSGDPERARDDLAELGEALAAACGGDVRSAGYARAPSEPTAREQPSDDPHS
jgi:glycerate kinase